MAEANEVTTKKKNQALDIFMQWMLSHFDSWTGWEEASISDDERTDMLKRMLHCALISKRFGESVFQTPKFAALRLAAAKSKAAPVRHLVYRQETFLELFESSLFVLRRSWVLKMPMQDSLRTSPLVDLFVDDLFELRRCLQVGWAEEFAVPRGCGEILNPSVWVTPGLRY